MCVFALQITSFVGQKKCVCVIMEVLAQMEIALFLKFKCRFEIKLLSHQAR